MSMFSKEAKKGKRRQSFAYRDSLTYRLSHIVIALFLGNKLSLEQLASDFKVSERTIYRDLHERLAMLDIERDNKYYFLSKKQYGARLTTSDLVRFAKMTYVDRLFPVLDNKLASILTGQNTSPFIVYTYPPKTTIQPFSAFLMITESILMHQCLTFDVTQASLLPSLNKIIHSQSSFANGFKLTESTPFKPYRLVFVNQEWFLVGSYLEEVWVCRYEEIVNVKRLSNTFTVNSSLLNVIESESFIQALPHFALLKALLNIKLT